MDNTKPSSEADHECPNCKGLKKISEESFDGRDFLPCEITCPRCKGNGRISAAEYALLQQEIADTEKQESGCAVAFLVFVALFILLAYMWLKNP